MLEISPNAPPEVIRVAYRALARMYHTDNAKTGNKEKFLKIQEAHRVLIDPVLRKAYDTELAAAADLDRDGGNGARPRRSSGARTGQPKEAYHPAYVNPYTGEDAFSEQAQEILEDAATQIFAGAFGQLLKQNLSPKMRQAVKQALNERGRR